MATTVRSTDLREPLPSTIKRGNWNHSGPDHLNPGKLVVKRFPVRVDRYLGFWLGGIILGAAGCFLGASMPYERPLGVAVGVFWWGIFLGCLGMNLGALLGLWIEHLPASLRRGSNDANQAVEGAPGRRPWSAPSSAAVGIDPNPTKILVLAEWPRYVPLPAAAFVAVEGVSQVDHPVLLEELS